MEYPQVSLINSFFSTVVNYHYFLLHRQALQPYVFIAVVSQGSDMKFRGVIRTMVLYLRVFEFHTCMLSILRTPY